MAFVMGLLLSLAWAAAARPAAATSWALMSFEKVLAEADIIAIGTVGGPNGSFPGRGGDPTIYTERRFTVRHYLRAGERRPVELRVATVGGEVAVGGGRMAAMPGHDLGEPGSEALLFLKLNGGLLTPVGGPNGVIRMAGGEPVVEGLRAGDAGKVVEFLRGAQPLPPDPAQPALGVARPDRAAGPVSTAAGGFTPFVSGIKLRTAWPIAAATTVLAALVAIGLVGLRRATRRGRSRAL